ncbi:potassium ion transporter [Diplodia corticola]|uniref:Potassium ion transporter n=1 Tax=Diplodia corticola TaxID=236234 RepID=A0A1J9R3U2_9PEZI|nr:potassium ion transporter [Diplodia corticola]OJD35249.1 potassium ion transporter [Diplodia corticola]
MQDAIGEVRNPHDAKEHFLYYLRKEVFHLNFYRMHMLYFVVVIVITSLIVYGEGLANDGGQLRYIDALFLCCRLNTVNLSSLTAFQQAVLCILLIIGSVPFVSSFVVIIRRHFFRRKLADVVQHSRSGRQIVRDVEEQDEREHAHHHDTARLRRRLKPRYDDDGNSDQQPLRSAPEPSHRRAEKQKQPPSQRLYHYASGRGFFPWPWESHTVQNAFHSAFRGLQKEWQPLDHSYISFDADFDERGRFRNLSEHERAELGGVEYRALSLILPLLLIYQLFWYALGAAILVPYAYRDPARTIIRTAQPSGSPSPGWWAFFAVTTSFSNGGLNLLDDNYVPFAANAVVLLVSAALTIAGNTQFPVFLRLAIWTLSRISPTTSRLRQTCLFLLHHPRRCFIYLFPSKETWYLFAIQILIDAAMWLLYLVLNLGLPAFDSTPLRTRLLDGLFQATGLRNSGAYIATVATLAPALLVAYLVTMYISSFPIVLTLRQTNTYEERSVGLDSTTTSSPSSSSTLSTHLRHQLSYDLWFQLLALFLLAILERPHFPSPTHLFPLAFETVSAYGTVGLSLGLSPPNTSSSSDSSSSSSLSAAFRTPAKLVVLAVMLRGRHRGLPLAVDRSILLPGEALMRRMDGEYDERGGWSEGEEEEVRRDEEGSECGREGSGGAGAGGGEARWEGDEDEDEDEDGGEGDGEDGAGEDGDGEDEDGDGEEEEMHFEIT